MSTGERALPQAGGPDESPSSACQGAASKTAFAVFSALFSIGWLANTLPWPAFQNTSHVIVATAAFWSLLRPSSVPRLAALALLAIGMLLYRAPAINNHELLGLIVSIAISIGIGRLWISRLRGCRIADFLGTFVTPLRWIAIVLYFWAFVHKLNEGFFDPDRSCASANLEHFSRQTLFGLGLDFLPTGEIAFSVAIYATIAIEGGLVLALSWKRTRPLAVVVAFAFHLLLGLGYPDFAALIFPLLVLFLPATYWNDLAQWWQRSRLRSIALRMATALTWRRLRLGCDTGFVVTILVLYASSWDSVRPIGPYFRTLDQSLWFPVASLLLVAVVLLLWRARRRLLSADEHFALMYRSSLVLPLLVFLNGLSPHVGLKTTQSFAMYSNLNTEGGQTNHYFLPASMQIFDIARDLVTIRRSSDDVLDSLSKRAPILAGSPTFESHTMFPKAYRDAHPPPKWQLPYMALRQRIALLRERGLENIEVEFERGGRVKTVLNAEDDPELAHVPFVARKFFRLRAVTIPRGLCQW